MLINEKLDDLVDAIQDIDEQLLRGLAWLCFLVIGIVFILWMVAGYIAPLWGGVVAWKLRTIILVIYGILEIAYAMGKQ